MNHMISKMTLGLKQRSVQTLLSLGIYILIAPFLPQVIHEGFYTLSLLIKDTLMWIMPLTVGFFIAHTVTSFERRAPLFVLVLIIFEAFSNLSSVWYAFGAASLVGENFPSIAAPDLKNSFTYLWRMPFPIPVWWSAEKGSIVGLALGSVTGFTKEYFLKRFVDLGKTAVEWLLTRCFASLIPLFILGFAAHMYQTKLLTHVCSHYAVLGLWLVLFLSLYIGVLFLLGEGFSLRRMGRSIKNLLPAGGIALTSACSLSTMPWTIEGAAKNLNNPQLAKAIIPATTNIQQIGDCITNTFLCFLIYKHFYGHSPEFMAWISFSIVFVLARFATAAVLGGAIFIMLPIYESYLSFNSEMIAIILGLNVVLDPLITSCNVMANGALCRLFERIWHQSQIILTRSLNIPSLKEKGESQTCP